MSLVPWGKTSLQASEANKLQILSSSKSLTLLAKAKFQWQMSQLQETTSWTAAFFKRAILKRLGN